jgi:hypothetical protein
MGSSGENESRLCWGKQLAMFEVLSGLPPYGDLPEAFTATGQGRHREGYVVKFRPKEGVAWVGNFQRGLSSFCVVVPHPNSRELLVIAGGQGYVVDPKDRSKRDYFGADIEVAIPVNELNAVVFGNGLWFESIGADGWLWRSGRISWDGMRDLRSEGLRLLGNAWSPIEDCWQPFQMDLRTGRFSGGSWNRVEA